MQNEALSFLAQLEEVRKQLAILQERLRSLELTKNTINELKNVKDQKELILPIGDEVFLRVVIDNPNKVIVNLGESILAEVSLDKAIELLNKKEEKVKKAIENLLKVEEELRKKIEEIYKNLQQNKK